jgi:hypothetical protein
MCDMWSMRSRDFDTSIIGMLCSSRKEQLYIFFQHFKAVLSEMRFELRINLKPLCEGRKNQLSYIKFILYRFTNVKLTYLLTH